MGTRTTPATTRSTQAAREDVGWEAGLRAALLGAARRAEAEHRSEAVVRVRNRLCVLLRVGGDLQRDGSQLAQAGWRFAHDAAGRVRGRARRACPALLSDRRLVRPEDHLRMEGGPRLLDVHAVRLNHPTKAAGVVGSAREVLAGEYNRRGAGERARARAKRRRQ